MGKWLRKYAPVFEWFEKGRKELGVVEELLVSLNAAYAVGWREPRLQNPDPPDCVCLAPSSDRVAIEVAEIVCEIATRLNAQGQRIVRDWQAGELTRHIAIRLAQKDAKIYHGGPYSEIAVCLFTDKPYLISVEVSQELRGVRFGPFRQITSAFLLFSYDPNTETYPVIRLQLAR